MAGATDYVRYKPVYIVELHLKSGLRIYSTRDIVLDAPSPPIYEEGDAGYNVGPYSGTTAGGAEDQGYDAP